MSPIRVLTPVAILAAGLAASALLFAGRPAARTTPSVPPLPPVRVMAPVTESVRLVVRSQGTVVPRTETDLVAEVPGRVLRIAPALEPGAFFRAGDLLAELDRRDFELAVGRARAALERALAERDFARATLERRISLASEGIASEALLDEARRAARVAAARRIEAAAELERAERDLERTRVIAPYDGRVRSSSIDVGQFVRVGSVLARIYAVDYAEVRLPLPDEELAHLDLPLAGVDVGATATATATGIEVLLRARFAGREHTWRGRVVRTEAEIDPRTRMVHVVARVANPYAGALEGRPPLAAGLFVEAEILGSRVENAMRVPRATLDGESTLWVVDEQDRLRRRDVTLLRVDAETAWFAASLAPGERLSISRPADRREGMLVRPVDEEAVAGRRTPVEPTS